MQDYQSSFIIHQLYKTMGNLELKGKDILKLGYPNNQSINALEVMKTNFENRQTTTNS